MMTRLTARQRGYGSAWERARAEYLASRPWCAMCAEYGRRIPAVHVHHTVRHRGNAQVFWDRSKWQGLCEEHHNRDAQQVETRGYASRVRCDGLPVDRSHPFYRGEASDPTIRDAEHPRGPESRAPKGAGPHGSRRAELVDLPRVPRWV